MDLPLLLALWTGQRQGDLLRLPWSAYDGEHIRLRQSKTGAPRRNSDRRAAQSRAQRGQEARADHSRVNR
jgi:integrase